ncbi:MAG: peptide chain release factor N(5)-glutamine methyltransferase [Lachnospiraceae bacterium]|nr:peptide chain release factor N(5)-glutamine methyltransferase [Lachnospiraceae bacterium]
MTLREAYGYGSAYLGGQGLAEGALDAWYLLEYITGKSRSYYYAHGEEELSADREKAYRELLQKRGEHIPLQHLTGTQEFMGLSFQVSPNVLIPRQDTEVLVEEALKTMKPGMRILDVCTGSGCILISLLAHCPGCEGLGVDISFEALAVAKENARQHQVPARFARSDMFAGVEERFNCIVSNPPYIASGEIPGLMEEVRDHEPRLALDGGADGLDFYRILAKQSADYLEAGGSLYLEIGYDQGEAVSGLLKEAGFARVRVIQDLCGKDRVVCGVKE